MILSFQLTMPGIASWNGKWSGEGKQYFIIKNVSANTEKRAKMLLEHHEPYRRHFNYRWDDGWAACIVMEPIDSAEAKKRRKLSAGFCGYDWMVNNILEYGKIRIE